VTPTETIELLGLGFLALQLTFSLVPDDWAL
jgi:hypothetical protein